MDEIVADYFPKIMVFGLGLFAILALALASLGLYGVVSFLAAQRTREIGLRIALGAGRGSILRLVLAQGLRFAILGALFGSLGALGLGRVLASQLAGVNAADPAVLALVSLLLFAVASAASLRPAWRAARLDPQTALREE